MADLSKIKRGDRLKLEVVVTMVETPQYVGKMAVQVKSVEGLFSDGYIWMDRPAIAAAERIPAPRVFKRGDWVKVNALCPKPERQNGIVLRLEQRTIVSFGSRLEVEVSWPDGQIHWYVPNDLEPDEAPE